MEKDNRSLRLLLFVVLAALLFVGFISYRSENVPIEKSPPIEIKSYSDRLEDEASSGNAEAMLRMGNDYKLGNNGLAPDSAEAIKWYEKAINHGNSEAMYALAMMYKNGDGVQKNYEKAASLFEKSIKAGNSSAVIGLANMHYFGHGTPQSYEKAYELWEKAAEQDNSEAMYNLSRAYYKGIGVEINFLKAGEYLFMAAENGDQYAQGLVGKYSRKCSEIKVGTKIYYDMKSCFLAAHSGDPLAMHAVGLSYYDGRFDQTIDNDKAFEWFEKSAKAGFSGAQYFLGMFYEKGVGTPQNIIESYAWMGTGLAQNDYSVEMLRKGKQVIEIIYNEMSEEQRLEAEDKLKAYVEKYAAKKNTMQDEPQE
jgi:TPR repeat protein